MMWLTGEEQQIIDIFWELAGEVEPFPRSLERTIAMALPIAVIKMPRLALGSIETWLRSRQIPYSFNCKSRFVRGCLVSYGGKGFVFCDGADPYDEIRFTLAHEVGHLLLHGKKGVNIKPVENGENDKELEADKYAQELLLRPSEYADFRNKQDYGAEAVARLAKKLSIDPGIIVGRLQHEELIGHNQLNHLRTRYTWKTT